MKEYNLYAGMNGSFGGPDYVGTLKAAEAFDAEEIARRIAIEIYQQYEGMHGILSYEECYEDCLEQYREDIDNKSIDKEDIFAIALDRYWEEVEGWIGYYAVNAEEDDLKEEKEYLELIKI